MATRRSRIKAVANLPARRNRPVASSDVKKEDLDSGEANDVPSAADVVARVSCAEASDRSDDVENGTLDQQPESIEVSCAIPTIDTKVNIEAALPNNNDSTSATAENPTTPASESANVNSTGSTKRTPLRTRRSKPTVNLTAAARKRPGNDSAVSTSCSTPPVKVKCVEPSPRKKSESDNSAQPLAPLENAASESKTEPVVENSLTVLTPLLPPPVTTSSPPTCKTLDNISGLFKTPATPPPKNKDPSPSNADGMMPISPQKDPSNSKRKQSSNAQRVAAARKNLRSRISSDGTAPRSALTMFDLIFYNPSKNPMKSTVPSSNESRPRLNSVSSVTSIHEDRLDEESIDDLDGEQTKEEEVKETAMPVPQVKVGPDGSLILDEQSLVIETTGAKKNREEIEKGEVIVDTGSSYGHYKKIVRSKDWSDHETKKFYRALNVVGTDFSLMKPYFRNRTRRELKIKFKKEERFNPNLIDKALGDPLDFDISELEKECELEDEEKRLEELAKEKAAEKLKETENGESKAKAIVVKKKKFKKCLVEIGEKEENGSATKKTRPQARVPKRKKITDADADYNMLALGVDLAHIAPSSKAKNKKTSGELEELNQEPKAAVENSAKKVHVKRVRRKPPLSDCNSSDSNTPSTSRGETSQEGGIKVPSITSCIVSAPSVKIVQSTSQSQIQPVETSQTVVPTCGVKVVPSNPQSRIQFVQASPSPIVPTSAPELVPATHIQMVQASSSTIVPSTVLKAVPATPQSRIQFIPVSSPSLAPTASPKGVPFTPQHRIQIIQTTPQASPPLASAGASTARTVNILKRPLPPSQPLFFDNQSTASTHSLQVPVLMTPSNSTCIIPTSGTKLVQTSSPLSRFRTVQVTPQSTSVVPGVGVTTPVSRLLPSTPPLPRMEPGSIIVLKTPLPQDPDRHVLQVYMVTNTPPGSTPSLMPHTPMVPGISLLSGPSVQPAIGRSPCIPDDADGEKVLTKL